MTAGNGTGFGRGTRRGGDPDAPNDKFSIAVCTTQIFYEVVITAAGKSRMGGHTVSMQHCIWYQMGTWGSKSIHPGPQLFFDSMIH